MCLFIMHGFCVEKVGLADFFGRDMPSLKS